MKSGRFIHGDYRPPEAYGNAGELIIGIGLETFGVVDERGENDNEQDEEKDEQVELFHGRLERVYENLETVRVTSELEETENAHDRDELIEVRVGHALFVVGNGENEVEVEGERGDEVDDVHGALDEVELLRTHQKPNAYLDGEPNVAHDFDVHEGRMRFG